MNKRQNSPIILLDSGATSADINPGMAPALPNLYTTESGPNFSAFLKKSDGTILSLAGGGSPIASSNIHDYATVSTSQAAVLIPAAGVAGRLILGFTLKSLADAVNPGVPGTLKIEILQPYPGNRTHYCQIDFGSITSAVATFKNDAYWFIPASNAIATTFAGYAAQSPGVLLVTTVTNDLTTWPFRIGLIMI